MYYIKLNENNYIKTVTTQPKPNEIYIEISKENFDILVNAENPFFYKYENEILTLDQTAYDDFLAEREENMKYADLRARRENECFSYVNRGSLWYAKMTEEELTEFNQWYNEWLAVTETLIIPTKPIWLT